jgi:hypothetical protein
MIDTVKFDIKLILTEEEIYNVSWTELTKRLKNNMVRCELFNAQDDTQPRIIYSFKEDDINRAWLKVELSLPRFLYGSNVYEMKQVDIKPAMRRLRRFIAKTLAVPLSRVPHYEEWEVEKLHFCKNFYVGPHLQHYLRLLSTMKKPGRYKTIPYTAADSNNLESVVFQSKSKRNKRVCKFYDKQAEVKEREKSPNKNMYLQEVEGILRFEIELSNYDMKKQSPGRLAKDLLTPQFAVKMLQEELNSLGLSKPIKQSSMKTMIDTINSTDHSIRTRSMLIAFLTELHLYGKEYCKQKYSRTTYYDNYNKLKDILGMDEVLITDITLPPLKVHKDSFKNKKRVVPPADTQGNDQRKTTNKIIAFPAYTEQNQDRKGLIGGL